MLNYDILDGDELFNWFQYGTNEVSLNKKQLNDINVFPVADGDTGSNLVTTMQAMISLSGKQTSFHETLNNLSETALSHARGNSGILFASYINGLADFSNNYDIVTTEDFSIIAQNAVSELYKAISNPVEGTIISVIKEWANYLASHHNSYGNFKDLLESAYLHATQALDATKTQLSELSKYNVVDSGAKGFVIFLRGINAYLTGNSPFIEESPSVDLGIISHEGFSGDFRYCTEVYFQLDSNTSPLNYQERLLHDLKSFGDSLIVSPSHKHIRIHIHTNQPHKIVALIQNYGLIIEQKVDDMELQNAVQYHPISKIGLLTDSIADLPDEYKLSHQIHTLPIGLSFNDIIYLDKLTIQPEQLKSMLITTDNYPSSSQPSPYKIKQTIDSLLEIYSTLFIVSVSDKMSSTYSSISNIITPYLEKGYDIRLIDSRLNSGAQGLLVQQACQLIENNTNPDEICQKLDKIISNSRILVCLHTLENAVRSGRVPNTVGKIGIKIGLRPIMTIDSNGNGTAYGMALSQKSITKKIIKHLKKQKNNISSYNIVHSDNLKLAKEYEHVLTNLLGKPPAYISEISSVVTIHSGLGSVAVSYIKEV